MLSDEDTFCYSVKSVLSSVNFSGMIAAASLITTFGNSIANSTKSLYCSVSFSKNTMIANRRSNGTEATFVFFSHEPKIYSVNRSFRSLQALFSEFSD